MHLTLDPDPDPAPLSIHRLMSSSLHSIRSLCTTRPSLRRLRLLHLLYTVFRLHQTNLCVPLISNSILHSFMIALVIHAPISPPSFQLPSSTSVILPCLASLPSNPHPQVQIQATAKETPPPPPLPPGEKTYHTQQPPRRLARLRTHTQPVLRPRYVQLYILDRLPVAVAFLAFGQHLGYRVVGPEDFERFRVPRRSAGVLVLGFWRGEQEEGRRGKRGKGRTGLGRRRCCRRGRGVCRSGRGGF